MTRLASPFASTPAFVAALAMLPCPVAAAPSIDCNAPRSPAERTVCKEPSLKELDAELGELVGKALEAAAGRRQAQQQFEKQQENWIRQGRDKCQENAGCLVNTYRQRINQVRSAMKMPPKAWPKPQPQALEANVATFDCKSPSSESQAAICSTPALTALDAELVGLLHDRVKDRGGTKSIVGWVEQSRGNWTKRTFDHCKDSERCLTGAYQREINRWLRDLGRPEKTWPAWEEKPAKDLAAARPAPLPPSRRDGDPFTLKGLWEGSYKCHNESLLITMEADGAGDSGVVRFEYYPAPGKEGPSGARKYNYRIESILGETTLRPGPLIGTPNGGRPQDAELSGFIGADGNTVKGSVRYAMRQCGEFSLMKVEKSTQRELALAPVALPPPVKPAVTMMAAKTYQEFCTVLRAWGDQYVRAHPEVRTAQGFSMAEQIQQENLLRDELFEPYFGKKLAEITQADLIAVENKWQQVPPWDQTGRKSCDSTGEQFAQAYYRFLRSAVMSGTAYREPIQRALAARTALVAAVEAVPVDRRSVERLNALLKESQERLKALWPTDRKAFDDAVEAKKKQIAGLALAGKLQDAASAPATLEAISDLHYLRQNAQGDEAARAKLVIERKVAEYSARETASLPQPVDNLEKLLAVARKQSDLRKKLAPYGEYDAARAALASIAARLKRVSDAFAPVMTARLATLGGAVDFYPYRDRLHELDQSGGDRSAIDPLWQIYLATVDSWVAGQIASAKTPQAGASAAAAGFDPANPLGASAAPAFDPANPLGQAAAGSPAPSADDEEFVNRPWKLAKFILAAFRNETPTLYEMGPSHVLAAAKSLGEKVELFCPSTMPLELLKMSMDQELGYDIFNPDLKSVFESVLRNVERTYRMGTNMGQTMQNLFQEEEFDRMLKADVQLLVAGGCRDPRLARVFANLLAFVLDPTAGVPPEKVSMLDICLMDRPNRKLPPAGRQKKYCACAAPIMGSELNDTQKKFVRLDLSNNFAIVRGLYPRIFGSLGKCVN